MIHLPLFSESTPVQKSLPSRETLDPKYQWQLEDIFSSDNDWEKSFQEIEHQLGSLPEFQNTLAQNARKLFDCLELANRISEKLYRVFLYAGLKNDQDTAVSTYQAFRDRATSLSVKFGQSSAFIEPEILTIPEKNIKAFLREHQGLAAYQQYFDNLLRGKAHILDAEQERLLAMAGEMAQSPYAIFSMFNNADISFPSITDENGNEVEVSKGRISRFLESDNRQVRHSAFQAMYNSYIGWTNTLAATLTANLKSKIFYANARGHQNALSAALHEDNISVSVYDNVVDSINDNLAPLHRYMAYRQRALKMDKLQPWDLFCPVVADVDFSLSYDEAKKLISEALKPLGEDYQTHLQSSFSNGWIDLYENQGKRAGAYSWSTMGVHPYILMNYNNTLGDVFTLAHELGHALHSHYTHAHQPYHYSHYTIFVAEVASTLNEALLMDHLLKVTKDPRKKLFLLNEYIDKIRGTVYIQALFAEFERTIYQETENGQPLTAERLNELCRELYTRYFGPAFEMDPLYDINWCRIPHFYYNFYVYKYATGFSAATALASQILTGDVKSRDAYLNFLTRGNSAYSIDLLKDAGVDMSQPDPILATTTLMNQLLDEMEALEKQIVEG